MNFVQHLGGGDWEEEIRQKWWGPQQEALSKAFEYLQSGSSRHAMIRMPTGTGKTAVIAALARLLQDYPKCLIVAPWRGLVKQLAREVESGFWAKSALTACLAQRSVTITLPSSIRGDLLSLPDMGVLVCTYQTLQALSSDDFAALKEWATLVLADEGHREPAPQWAEAIRRLAKPTILFTATPYRNDLQLFDLDAAYCYTYTFPEAREAHFIRDVEFHALDWPATYPQSIEPFVDQVRQTRDEIINADGLDQADARVIIRCETEQDVRAVTRRLRSLGETAIGIHERFKKEEAAGLYGFAPDPAIENAQYWVHQFKLLEGLDDCRFRIAAIHGNFGNARNLVQQVGRLIRNPSFDANARAHIVVRQGTNQQDLWDRFLKYESEIRDRVARGGSELDYINSLLLNVVSGNQFYFLGNFRTPLEPGNFTDPREVVRMRKTVAIFSTMQTFVWDKCKEALESEVRQSNSFTFGPSYQDASTYLQFVVTASQSSFTDDAFLDIKLGYVFAKCIDSRLYWFGSSGGVPEYVKTHCELESPDSIGRLLPDKVSRIGEISLVSGDFGNASFRRRSLSAYSLDEVPPSLSDYVQVCTTATGRTTERVDDEDIHIRRYLGFSRSRVSQRTDPRSSFTEFEAWLAGVHSTLDNAGLQMSDAFARFATPEKHDPRKTAVHVLFDVSAEGIDSSTVEPIEPAVTEGDLWKVTDGRFVGEVDSKQFNAKLRFDDERQEYRLSSEANARMMFSDDGGTVLDYFEYLNGTQDFRVLMDDGSFYCQGRFLKPNTTPWRGGGQRVNIGNILRAHAGLSNVQSEKGQAGDDWSRRRAPNSVFGCILEADGIFGGAFKPEILVCGDVASPEVADFFALDEAARRLIMIHAKNATPGSSLSASAFHDVCGQATRYLRFFNPAESKARLTAAQIRRRWRPSGDYSSQDRLVWSDQGKGVDAVVSAFNNAVSDVTYRREVWIVMGHGLSKVAFETAMRKANPEPNEKELAYLLQSTWSACASVGASLTVFCKP